MMTNTETLIAEHRNSDIAGRIVDLSPVTEKDLSEIIRMRIDPKMMYYFNQPQEISLIDQQEWFRKYQQRTDDLYWTIKNKDGLIVGTNRLYNVTSDKCYQGSLMVDTRYSRTAPFSVEAIMLSLDFAFNVLGVHTVINENRHDNKNMNSLSKRFGFKFIHEVDIRGVVYKHHELYRENYKREDIESVLNLWLSR